MQVNASGDAGCDFRWVSDPLAFLVSHCTPVVQHVLQSGPRTAASLLGMFLLGAVGSVTHCGAMCGPLVIGQVTERLAAVPAPMLCEAHRLRSGLLLPYHAGRLLTYAALGAASGAVGLAFVSHLASLRSVLLLLAAAMLVASATGSLPFRPAAGFGPLRWLRSLDRTRARGTFLFGMIMGLLPCGLLYAALVGACALATPARGAAGMLLFGAGTVPMLALVGIAGQLSPVRRALPALLAANALVLAIAALGGLLI
jgi:sulfite exporter TauE/SafE